MGAEWHRFPSHFLFNDDRTRLQYIRDGFFGILPQPFGNTTFDPPLLKVNDKNREEFDRYIPLAECDYVLLTVDGMDKRTEEIIGRRICTDGLQDLKADGSKHMTLHKGHLHRGACFRGDSFQAVAAEDVLSYRVMQVGNGRGARALATVLRAFYLPYLSEKHVPRAAFTLLKHIRRES